MQKGSDLEARSKLSLDCQGRCKWKIINCVSCSNNGELPSRPRQVWNNSLSTTSLNKDIVECMLYVLVSSYNAFHFVFWGRKFVSQHRVLLNYLCNRPFYGCLLSDPAYEWRPCIDTDLTVFIM